MATYVLEKGVIIKSKKLFSDVDMIYIITDISSNHISVKDQFGCNSTFTNDAMWDFISMNLLE